MAFHHRKLLPGKPDPLGDKSSPIPKPCPKICLPPCPDHCNPIPQPPPPSPSPPPTLHAVHNTSIILVIVLCLLGFAFLVVSYLSIIRYRSNVRNTRRRSLQAFNDSGEGVVNVHENHDQVLDHHVWYIRTVGLQQSVIDLIEVFKYKKGGGIVEGSDCSVCLSEFREDEDLKLLPKCSHAFHVHCIDTWLRSHKNCPVCRAPVVNEANVGVGVVEELDSGSSSSEEENRVESGSDLAEVGSGEDSGGMRVNYLEDRSSLTIEDNDVDDIPDGTGNKVGEKYDMDDDGLLIYLGEENNFRVKDEGSSSTKEDEGTSNCHSEGETKQTSEIVPRAGNLTSSIYNLVKSSSIGRSLQNVPLSMKRSFTSGGKSSLPTHREDSS